jgi:hypothetical protein
MPDCMRELAARGLREAVLEAAQRKPFLGICIGLQMLFDWSEEGDTPGLALLRGKVVRFTRPPARGTEADKLKVPHMGWNEVRQTRAHPLWSGIADGTRFYFVHSYYPAPVDPGLAAGVTEYSLPFASAVAHKELVRSPVPSREEPDRGSATAHQLRSVGWCGRCEPRPRRHRRQAAMKTCSPIACERRSPPSRRSASPRRTVQSAQRPNCVVV